MDRPIYVIKTNEAVLMPVSGNRKAGIIRSVVLIILGILILGSVIFRSNLFMEMNWMARLILIALIVGSFFTGPKREDVPSPVEIQFYDTYLVIYRPKRYYSSRKARREFNTMNYSEISKCLYKTQSRRLQIYGTVKAVWFDYQKDGSLSDTPSYDRVVSGTMQYMSMKCSDIDIVSEIEAHSPLKVTVEDS